MFLRRLSSAMDTASSVPSGSCALCMVVGDAAGEGVSCEELVLCGTARGGIDIGYNDEGPAMGAVETGGGVSSGQG